MTCGLGRVARESRMLYLLALLRRRKDDDHPRGIIMSHVLVAGVVSLRLFLISVGEW